MKLTLKLRFQTAFGQSLLVTGSHPLLGAGNAASAVPLAFLNEDSWQVTLSFPRASVPKSGIRYNYVLRQPDSSTGTDCHNHRQRHSD